MIPVKQNSSLPSSGITNLRWPEDDTAWGRNGWNEKPLTVSAQQTIKVKLIICTHRIYYQLLITNS